ncbi:MAG: GNAT family acetyltransferase [Minwuia sp.]|nr:GNAT family acetyltransferase [Minwuia sp.]
MSTDPVRAYRPADRDQVVALWQTCDLTRPWNDPDGDIGRAQVTSTSVLLVHADGDRVNGTLMAGYDGHRGWMYYLASDPASRGGGIARALVHRAEDFLRDQGCPKAELMVRSSNDAALGFYDRLGYEAQDVVVRGKWLNTN